jgi:acetyl esterase/lipase
VDLRVGDVSRLFLAGDSAGGNIVHDMLVRTSGNNGRPSIEGAILFHPWFGGAQAIDGESENSVAFTGKLWACVCPGAVGGSDDPRINPLAPGAPALEKLGCARMLVCAAKKDALLARNRAYYDAVAAREGPGLSGWSSKGRITSEKKNYRTCVLYNTIVSYYLFITWIQYI